MDLTRSRKKLLSRRKSFVEKLKLALTMGKHNNKKNLKLDRGDFTPGLLRDLEHSVLRLKSRKIILEEALKNLP